MAFDDDDGGGGKGRSTRIRREFPTSLINERGRPRSIRLPRRLCGEISSSRVAASGERRVAMYLRGNLRGKFDSLMRDSDDISDFAEMALGIVKCVLDIWEVKIF